MKITKPRSAAVVGLLTLASGYADTVTTLDHLSVNGVLSQMSGGTITLEARYSSGPRTRTILMSTVETIEFNSTAFNPPAPSKAPGVGPGVPTAPRPALPKQPVVTDAVELRGGSGERQPCKVVSIDENLVHCEPASSGKDKGKAIEYPRRNVLRILVGGSR
jgi:hypothetical protein